MDEARLTRDPVKQAEASPSAKRKKNMRKTIDGLPVQSFKTLIVHLGTRCRNTLKIKTGSERGAKLTFEKTTEATPLQAKAFQLLGLFPVARK
ncbi:hypothetical protein ACFL1X_10955 [Candidatus Hydrogenedentota bacterium]